MSKHGSNFNETRTYEEGFADGVRYERERREREEGSEKGAMKYGSC